jgi:hypothetical protein
VNICYLIQSHRNPEQLERLVRCIKQQAKNAIVLISHDFSSCILDIQRLEKIPGVYLFAMQGKRGDFSIVQGYLDAVRWLVRSGLAFDWVVNLSGQDYPTQALSKLEAFLTETEYDGFMESFQAFSEESHWKFEESYSRYFFHYVSLLKTMPDWAQDLLHCLKLVNYIQPFFRINFCYGLTVGYRIATPFSIKFKCFGGSYLCMLSRRCIIHMLEFVENSSHVVDYYRQVQNADESFFHTLLLNSRKFKISKECKRFFDFPKLGHGHPRVLTTGDYDLLTNQDVFFARKFDSDQDSQILDLLDRAITQNAQPV